MKDRVILGGIAGLIGSSLCTISEVMAERMRITDRSFLDYSATLVSHRVNPGIPGFIVGFLAQAAVGVVFGVIFAGATPLCSPGRQLS